MVALSNGLSTGFTVGGEYLSTGEYLFTGEYLDIDGKYLLTDEYLEIGGESRAGQSTSTLVPVDLRPLQLSQLQLLPSVWHLEEFPQNLFPAIKDTEEGKVG